MLKLLVSLLVCLHGTLATAQTWGEPYADPPEVYSTSDVGTETVELVKYWHDVAARAWGNWGPCAAGPYGPNCCSPSMGPNSRPRPRDQVAGSKEPAVGLPPD